MSRIDKWASRETLVGSATVGSRYGNLWDHWLLSLVMTTPRTNRDMKACMIDDYQSDISHLSNFSGGGSSSRVIEGRQKHKKRNIARNKYDQLVHSLVVCEPQPAEDDNHILLSSVSSMHDTSIYLPPIHHLWPPESILRKLDPFSIP